MKKIVIIMIAAAIFASSCGTPVTTPTNGVDSTKRTDTVKVSKIDSNKI